MRSRNIAGFGQAEGVEVLSLGKGAEGGDVSKNRGILPPKWLVKIMEHPIKMDDLGGFPIFLETPM